MPTQIKDRDGSLIVAAFPNMPDSLRSTLAVNLESCFPGPYPILRDMNSAKEGGGFVFPALHFSWWNRYGMRVCVVDVKRFSSLIIPFLQGHEVPKNVHPMHIEKEDGSRVNRAQLLPYISQDACKHQDIYHSLQSVFQKLFEWVAEQVCPVIELLH